MFLHHFTNSDNGGVNQSGGVGISRYNSISCLYCFCCCCMSEEARLQRKINQKIEHQLRKEKRNARRNIKLLLLGTGESGKSTFIRQMRIIHEHGFESIPERCEYVAKIQQNIVTTVYTIDHAMSMLNIEYEHDDLPVLIREHVLKVTTNYDSVYCWRQRFDCAMNEQSQHQNDSPSTKVNRSPLSGGVPVDHIPCLQFYQSIVQLISPLTAVTHLEVLHKFWSDCGVQQCLQRRNEYNLLDSSNYFMSRLGDILSDGYVPTVQDILRVRIPTNGINEYTFGLESINFLMVDVGGQRTERRKWIHCFENVTSILFIVALSEFDQILFEPGCVLNWRNSYEVSDHQHQNGLYSLVNRLEESKALFKTIVTSEWFRHSSVILFLNKYDLFEEKILYGVHHLKDYFDAYNGPVRDAANAADFILQMFYQLEPNIFRKRVIYSHMTCATDTKNIKLVFQAVKDTILEQMLCKEIQIF